MQGQRGGDRPGPNRVVPGGAPLRAEAGLRGLAVHPGAGAKGGRADRPPAGADEVRPGLAAAEAEGAPEARGNSPGFDVRAALYYVVGLDLTEIEGVSER